ncbi:hypothetical protein SUGI_0409010 [Cryptomeria japonica]|nr:hypothetical protein SUGI_0409010 [Cryptomeria japonica]
MESKWSFKVTGQFEFNVKKLDMQKVRWKAPDKGWTKLNFDGASKGNPGKAGFRTILRNGDGSFIQGVYGNLGEITNNEAEI